MKRNKARGKTKVTLCRIYPGYEDCGFGMCTQSHSLGVRCLKAYCEADAGLRKRYDISILEFPATAGAARIGKAVAAQQPDVAGFSVYVSEYPVVLEVAAGLKRMLPETLNVLGGLRVLDSAEEMRTHGQIDVFVDGEGEIPFSEILRRFSNGCDFAGIPGVAWRAEGKVILNKGKGSLLSAAEIPDIFTAEYVSKLKGAVRFPTSRGCAGRCTFCPEAGVKYRDLPLETVLRGLELLLKNPRVGLIVFDDPDFGWNKSRFEQILDFIIAKNTDGKIFSGCWNARGADRRLLEKMKRAGFTRGIDISLQSGNPETLARVKRKWMNLDYLGKIAPDLLDVFPEARAEVIAGLPLETRDSFTNTLAELYRMGFRSVRSHRLRVYPATELFRQSAEHEMRFQPGGHYHVMDSERMTRDDMDFAEVAVSRYNVIAQLLPPEFAKEWDALGVRVVDLLRNFDGFEKCTGKNGLRKNALDMLCAHLRRAGVSAGAVETAKHLSRAACALREHELRIRDMMGRGGREAARPLHGYAEIRVPPDVLPYLGLESHTPAGTSGRCSVFILFNSEKQKAVPVASRRPGVFRKLLKRLSSSEDLSEFLRNTPENKKGSVAAFISVLAGAGILRIDGNGVAEKAGRL